MSQRYRIQFPKGDAHTLDQNQAYFHLIEDGERLTIRFHDYAAIYSRPGLYEQLFYERLQCSSPAKIASILDKTVAGADESLTALRVLDFGAGNGIMGQEMKQLGASRVVGLDLIEEARAAAERDRPDVYDDYLVADITQLTPDETEALADWHFTCLTSVAALGFGDIPAPAFARALKLVAPGGWVAFNIRDTFLDHSDRSGFSRMIRELLFSEYLDLFHLEKYRHRLSIDGEPLFYFALVAKKLEDIPQDFLEALDADPD